MSVFETAGPALTGIAAGMRDVAQTEHAQSQVALTQEAIKKAQEDAAERERLRKPVKLSDLYGATPVGKYAQPIMDNYLMQEGVDVSKGEASTAHVEKAQAKLASDPRVMTGVFTSYKADLEKQSIPHMNDIEAAKKKIAELEASRNSVTQESGALNEKVDRDIAKQKQLIAEATGRMQPLVEQKNQADIQIANMRRVQDIQEVGKMNPGQQQIYSRYVNDPKYAGLSPMVLVQQASEDLEKAKKTLVESEPLNTQFVFDAPIKAEFDSDP